MLERTKRGVFVCANTPPHGYCTLRLKLKDFTILPTPLLGTVVVPFGVPIRLTVTLEVPFGVEFKLSPHPLNEITAAPEATTKASVMA